MKSGFFSTTALIIGIVIVVNLLAYEFYLRLDLTEDKQYTLSEATKDLLNDLEEPVTVKAYFSKDLPPNILKTRKDFQDLLIEYANRSDGQVVYEFINPNESESYEKEAVENGIQPVLIDVREKDQMKQQKGFLGATIHLGEKKEVIPVVRPGAAMEYALSTAIKKISVDNKPVVGFIQGHGEPSLLEMAQAREQLSVLYEPQEVSLTDSTEIADNIKTLALIRPTDSIPASHLQKLDAFLATGGRLLVALNSVQGDLNSFQGMPVQTGLESWLSDKGLNVMKNFVIDARCGSIPVPQQFGGFVIQSNVSFPYAPVIGAFADHSITSGLESILMEFPSEVTPTGDSTRKFTPLAFSSELSNALPTPQFFDLQKQWTASDFNRKNITVAAALEDKTWKMVVIGDGDFPVNGPPYQQQQRRREPDNINLLANSIDWLSDDTGLIALRTRGAVSRPIRELDDATKLIVKYTNFLLPILLVVGYGLFRAQKNRMIRLKRMNENYETV